MPETSPDPSLFVIAPATHVYTLSLHDALPISGFQEVVDAVGGVTIHLDCPFYEPIFNLTTNSWDYFTLPAGEVHMNGEDRKSTRLNSSHVKISYAVSCLKKKNVIIYSILSLLY